VTTDTLLGVATPVMAADVEVPPLPVVPVAAAAGTVVPEGLEHPTNNPEKVLRHTRP
jgi:hypothetical protein